MGLILTLVILSLVVLVHEYGHYVVMRRNGIEVEEFTIGFGPTLFQRQLKSGTWFRIKPILLGGYAKPKDPNALETCSGGVLVRVALAGPMANALTATLVSVIGFYALGGIPVPLVPFASWAPSFLQPLVAGTVLGFGMVIATPYLIAKLLIGGRLFATVSGPIGIVTTGQSMTAGEAAAGTPWYLGALTFFVILNVGLGGFNLLPLMPLDGGRICMPLVRTFGPRAVKVYSMIGYVLFLGLFILAISSDIFHLFNPR